MPDQGGREVPGPPTRQRPDLVGCCRVRGGCRDRPLFRAVAGLEGVETQLLRCVISESADGGSRQVIKDHEMGFFDY
jgi:hypothetical protein